MHLASLSTLGPNLFETPLPGHPMLGQLVLGQLVLGQLALGHLMLGLFGLFLIYQLVAEFMSRREERMWHRKDLTFASDSSTALRRQPPADANRVDTAPPPARIPDAGLEDGTWKGWRLLRIDAIVDESPDCRSFRFTAIPDSDGQPLPRFRAGQSILVAITDPATGKRVSRCYSLSGGPEEPHYRITVKRVPGGKVSNLLHDTAAVGDTIWVQAPRGGFHCNPQHDGDPLVLIAAGIGITPMLSMLLENLETSPQRPVHLFYQLRTPANAPFLESLRSVVARCSRTLPLNLHVFFSNPAEEPTQADDSIGRIDANHILTQVGQTNGECMICGPDQFMASIAAGLVTAGVPEDHVHYESFGGKSKGVGAIAAGSQDDAAGKSTERFQVRFAESDQAVTWTGSEESLLDLAEDAGVEIESSCRSGSCGACVCRLKRGTVAYDQPPEHDVDAGEVLMCVARPTSDVEIESTQ
ncbi:2Fe-2S iron-sulfur cluster-binding protein [Rubripirellula lacrimiformis]|nr:2Fe-2S iron-sulfur cluster-binding protein [Rubripirellula lacrimiformis]